jgi:hypothetical protein
VSQAHRSIDNKRERQGYERRVDLVNFQFARVLIRSRSSSPTSSGIYVEHAIIFARLLRDY